jgi:hypothetical protein
LCCVLSHIPASLIDSLAFPEGSIFTVRVADFTGQLSTEEQNSILGVAMSRGLILHRDGDRTIYSMGKYGDFRPADSLKSLIVTGGLSTAKVLEFINNKLVDYEGTGPVQPKKKGQHATTGTNEPQPANAPPSNNNPGNVNTPTNTGNAKVIFCVQIGAYKGEIPIDVANNLIKIAGQGIATHQEDDGVTTYTVGSYNNYDSAKLFKEELVQDGFPGCFVVAYNSGKKISLEEAQTLINK